MAFARGGPDGSLSVMTASHSSPLDWTNIFRPLGEQMSSQLAGALANFRLTDEAQRHYDELAEKKVDMIPA